MKRWRRLIAGLLALLGLAGLLIYLWPLVFGPQPVSPPPPVTAQPEPTPSSPAPVSIEGDVSISFDYSSSNGDVHIHTADGLYYDLQLVGEFTAVKSSVDDLEIQVRQGPWQGSSKTISTNVAVAMNVAGDRVAINVGQSSLYINGEATPLPTQAVALPKGGQIVPAGSQISIVWPDQTTAQVTSHGSYLDLLVKLADTRAGKVAGLFGNFDKKAANDLTARDGSVIAISATADGKSFQQQLYQQFGNSWRIGQSDSLFFYAPGESTSTWTDLNFPYQIVSTQSLDPSVRQHAEEVCKQAGVTARQFLDDCILDVGVTGDDQFSQSTAQIEAAMTLPEGLECQSASDGGFDCTDYQTSLPNARVGSLYQFTIETMLGNAKQVESFDCSRIDATRRASCRIKTKGEVFDGSATVARYTLDSGETQEKRGVMRPH